MSADSGPGRSRAGLERASAAAHRVGWGFISLSTLAYISLLGGSLGILIVVLAPNVAMVLVGWRIAQLLFNALLAALAAVLPDQVPAAQRGLVSGFWASVCPSRR